MLSSMHAEFLRGECLDLLTKEVLTPDSRIPPKNGDLKVRIFQNQLFNSSKSVKDEHSRFSGYALYADISRSSSNDLIF